MFIEIVLNSFNMKLLFLSLHFYTLNLLYIQITEISERPFTVRLAQVFIN